MTPDRPDALDQPVIEGAGPSEVPLDVEIVTSREAAQSIRSDWRALSSGVEFPSLDADPDFFLGMLHRLTPPATPYIAVFRHMSRARGLLVARLRKLRVPIRVGYLDLRAPMTLSCLEVVFGGLITDETVDARIAVRRHLASCLHDGIADCISVHHVPSGHALSEDLLHGFPRSQRGVVHRQIHWFARLRDPHTASPLALRSPKTERRLAGYDRRLRRHFEDDVSVALVTQAGELGDFLRCASQITGRTYQKSLGVGVDDSPRWRGLLELLSELGSLRAYVLRARGEAIAYLVAAFREGQSTLLAQSFLPEHRELKPGNFLLRRALEATIAEGGRSFDFGFGDSVQKQRFGTVSREEVTFTFYASGLRARSTRALESGAHWSAQRMSGMLRRIGAFDRVKRAWRSNIEQNP
jgi:hypothetical protein